MLRHEDEVTLVQCKQWKARQVGVATVRELYGVMASESANRGMLVTCGQFTSDAKAFTRGKSLELVDGVTLLTLIGQVQKSSTINPAVASEKKSSTQVEPPCPRCGKRMVLRKARKGHHAGKQFWGCMGFPQCRGTKELSQ